LKPPPARRLRGACPHLTHSMKPLCSFLTHEPYALGDTRAVMIEGPSQEALELVEVG
jgi:hypothetical protein